MPAEGLHGRVVGVDRLEPGDHAFWSYADEDTRWEVLSVFAQQGFERDEKVGLTVDDGHSPDWVASRVAGSQAAGQRALKDGQLVVSGRPDSPRGSFDAGRTIDTARHQVDTVLSEGFAGLRSACEMSGKLAAAGGLDQIVEYEAALHGALFTGQPNQHYTALCYWDERRLPGPGTLDAVRSVHPVALLPRLGALRTAMSGEGVSLSGDSDLANRESFDHALASLAAMPQATLVLDITDLSFFDAHSAGAVLRLAAGLTAPRRLEVRCRSAQRRLLHVLGGRSVRQLSVITVRL
jgi:MEDS: MEthanogen/methylotroph, DcmR Sensory domain